jgi:hypothetical protein
VAHRFTSTGPEPVKVARGGGSPPGLHRSHTAPSQMRAIQETRPDRQAASLPQGVIVMTSTPRQGPGWAMTALRRAIGTLRYLNDELTRANEALFRPVGAPRAGRPEAVPPARRRQPRQAQATTPASPNLPRQARVVSARPRELSTGTSLPSRALSALGDLQDLLGGAGTPDTAVWAATSRMACPRL